MAATFRFTPEPYRTRLTGQLAIIILMARQPDFQRKSLKPAVFKQMFMHP
jgi:hypothetical protein